MFASIDIPHRLDTDELHHAGPAFREGTDRERPEDVLLEAGHSAELPGERARIIRRDHAKETVRPDRPDSKCGCAVVGGKPAAHHETGTGESGIGLASGRHGDGLFCCDIGAQCHQCQNESEDAKELQFNPLPFHSSFCLHPSAFCNSLGSIGNDRTRLPVSAKSAFATAGAIGGTGGSPVPVGNSRLGTMCTSMTGISLIRNIS
jgi:hypothetical protein